MKALIATSLGNIKVDNFDVPDKGNNILNNLVIYSTFFIVYIFFRRTLKKSCINERESFSKTPPFTAIFVLNLGSPHN